MLQIAAVKIKCPKCRKGQVYGFLLDEDGRVGAGAQCPILDPVGAARPMFFRRDSKMYHSRDWEACDFEGPAHVSLKGFRHLCQCGEVFSINRTLCPKCRARVIVRRSLRRKTRSQMAFEAREWIRRKRDEEVLNELVV